MNPQSHRPGPRPGSYVVVFHGRRSEQLTVGRLGVLRARPGFYLYVGSAFGPGGVAARVVRHLQPTRRRHWHVDYLKPALVPIAVAYTHDPARREHAWARVLGAAQGFAAALPRFGASDCRCVSHLWYTTTDSQVGAALAALRSASTHFEVRVHCRRTGGNSWVDPAPNTITTFLGPS